MKKEEKYEYIKNELESLSNLFCTALGVDVDTPEKKKIAKNAYIKGGLACFSMMQKKLKKENYLCSCKEPNVFISPNVDGYRLCNECKKNYKTEI